MNQTTSYDSKLRIIPNLTWLPWVCTGYFQRPKDKRLLIVGESHYIRPESPDQFDEVLKRHLNYPNYTRDVVSECLIYQEWPNRTLDTLPKLLFKTPVLDRERFWGETAFYNFVQTPMHYNRAGAPERPSWDSLFAGWSVFLDVVRILKPSHCLFIGIAALNAFNYSMNHHSIEFEEVKWTEKISRTYGRKASLKIDDQLISLIGVQHLGKYFSWEKWNDYLVRQHPDLMGFLHAEKYTNNS
jgi:hypothetical protein